MCVCVWLCVCMYVYIDIMRECVCAPVCVFIFTAWKLREQKETMPPRRMKNQHIITAAQSFFSLKYNNNKTNKVTRIKANKNTSDFGGESLYSSKAN